MLSYDTLSNETRTSIKGKTLYLTLCPGQVVQSAYKLILTARRFFRTTEAVPVSWRLVDGSKAMTEVSSSTRCSARRAVRVSAIIICCRPCSSPTFPVSFSSINCSGIYRCYACMRAYLTSCWTETEASAGGRTAAFDRILWRHRAVQALGASPTYYINSVLDWVTVSANSMWKGLAADWSGIKLPSCRCGLRSRTNHGFRWFSSTYRCSSVRKFLLW